MLKQDIHASLFTLPRALDQGHFSLTLALNVADAEFAGGGTRFRHAAAAHALQSPPAGAAVPSSLVHAGERITSGVRYIIAAFLWVDAPPPPNARC
jgi:hypothetical protein